VQTTTGPAQSVLTRGANATVEIPSGQTIAIAGLLSEQSSDNIDKFPGLGNIPILGALFRSQEFQKSQTELVIFVTPKLASSFDPRQAKLPTEGFVEPSQLEFYLLGKQPQQRSAGKTPGRSGTANTQALGPDKHGTEGVFGHDL
jgi:pilus assembly protein CpaC